MSELKIVVIELEELRRMISEEVKASLAVPVADEWVDAHATPFSRRRFLRLGKEGAFPVSRDGKKHVARRRDIDGYLDRQRVGAAAPAPATPPVQAAGTADGDPIADALAQGRLRIVKKRG